MHTYRRVDDHRGDGWQVIYQHSQEPRYEPLGPIFGVEAEAAAFASFLNGGRYNPYEIETVFAVQAIEVDDDSIHPDRPKAFDDDYPLERKRG